MELCGTLHNVLEISVKKFFIFIENFRFQHKTETIIRKSNNKFFPEQYVIVSRFKCFLKVN